MKILPKKQVAHPTRAPFPWTSPLDRDGPFLGDAAARVLPFSERIEENMQGRAGLSAAVTSRPLGKLPLVSAAPFQLCARLRLLILPADVSTSCWDAGSGREAGSPFRLGAQPGSVVIAARSPPTTHPRPRTWSPRLLARRPEENPGSPAFYQ